jgi:cellulose synthase (UDP-forming)
MLHLDELESSGVMIALVFGGAILATSLLDKKNQWHRALLFGIAIILSLRYFWWRLTETLAPFDSSWSWLFSWSFMFFEGAAMLSSISSFVLLTRHRDRSGEASGNMRWWPSDKPPSVAILIATYNEERAVLARTIIGSKAQDHEAVTVHVLDDGKRDWLRDFCVVQGVHYVRRSDNKGSKAGNINHALGLLRDQESPPQFIAVLDADFVPHHDFVSKSLTMFRDENVGLVQTPQHFFNPDPIQHNLGLSRAYPDEQRFFFDHLQPSRDGWGIAFCCGTSSMVRWTALEAIGGLPTESITEDFLLTLTLEEKGWHTAYLNEPLTEGLAPEGLKEYVTQRARWCLGLMQIARGRLGPLAPNGLRLRDRWSVLDGVFYWLTSFPFRLAALVYPLFYWYFNITVVNATVPDVLSYFGAYLFWVLAVLNFISGGLVVPLINDVSQLLGAIPITRAAIMGLVKPKGHTFTVTAKGGDRTKVVVQWRMMAPFLLLFALTLAGLLLGLLDDRFAYNDAGDGKIVVLFWTVYNLFLLALAILVCVEAPRVEIHIKDRPQRALLRFGERLHRVWLIDLTQEAVRMRGLSPPIGEKVLIGLRKVGDVKGVVIERSEDGCRLSLDLDEEQHQALLRRLYSEGQAPGVTATRFSVLASEAIARLAGR